MNRPLAPPLLPLAGKDQFQSDLMRSLTPFLIDVVGQLNTQVQGLGSDLESQDTIYVTAAMHRVGGAQTINRIEVAPGFTGPVWLLATGAWKLGTAGNVAKATEAAVGKAVTVIYDGTRWYPTG